MPLSPSFTFPSIGSMSSFLIYINAPLSFITLETLQGWGLAFIYGYLLARTRGTSMTKIQYIKLGLWLALTSVTASHDIWVHCSVESGLYVNNEAGDCTCSVVGNAVGMGTGATLGYVGHRHITDILTYIQDVLKVGLNDQARTGWDNVSNASV